MNYFKFFIIGLVLSMTLQAHAYSPDAVDSYNKGVEFTKKRDYESAIEAFQKATFLDPDFLDAYYNLGSVYYKLGDIDNAIESYKNLLTLFPEDDNSIYKIAALYYKKGNLQQALKFANSIPKTSSYFLAAEKIKKKSEKDIIQKAMEETKNNLSNQELEDVGNLDIAAYNSGDLDAEEEIILTEAANLEKKEQPTEIKTVIEGFNGPTGIAKDSDGNIYVANFISNSIMKISDDGTKTVIEDKNLNGPIGVAIDSVGNIYVANYLSNEVLKIDRMDGKTKVLINDIKKPYYIFIDNDDNVYISEQGTNTIIKLKSN